MHGVGEHSSICRHDDANGRQLGGGTVEEGHLLRHSVAAVAIRLHGRRLPRDPVTVAREQEKDAEKGAYAHTNRDRAQRSEGEASGKLAARS